MLEHPLDNESDDACESCGDPFGSGEFAQSRSDASLCHYGYTSGADDQEYCDDSNSPLESSQIGRCDDCVPKREKEVD